MSVKQLEKLFNPGHISVIGNLHKGICKGNTILKNLVNNEFKGTVSAVSREWTITKPDNVDIFPSIDDIPQSVDIAIFTSPLYEIYDFLTKTEDIDKISNVIITTGLENSYDKKSLEDIVKLAKKANFRIIGINSIGIIIPGINLNASFYSNIPKNGNIAFVSQSGAILTSVLDHAKQNGIGFKYILSIGSIADVDFGDIIDFLWGENDVKSTMLYIEKVRNVRKFLSAARHTSRIKPILAVKSGNNRLSNEIIKKRAMEDVGRYIVYDNAFRRAGIIKVDKIDELLLAADILTKFKIPESDKIAVITNSGGAGILAVDEFKNRKLKLYGTGEELKEKLITVLSGNEFMDNPIDVSGSADEDTLIKTAEICLKSSEFDTIMFIFVVNGLFEPAYVMKEIKNKNIYNKRLLFLFMGGSDYYKHKLSKLETVNVSVFFNLNEAVDSYYYGVSYRHKLRKLIATPSRFSTDFKFNASKARSVIEKHLTSEICELPFNAAREVLKSYDINILESLVVKNLNHAFFKAEKIGYPVNIVIFSENFNKKEFRKIDSQKQLKKTYHEVIDFKKDIDAVFMEKYIENVDIVLQVGVKTDIEIGPYLFLGLGGKYKRILNEISVMLPPLNKFLALRLIERSYLHDFLKNLGLSENLEELLVKLSYLCSDFSEIHEIIIDPLVNLNNEFCALDFKIKVKKANVKPPYHFVILPYPNNYEFTEKLPDGTDVLIRPIKPEDEDLHLDFFYSLSKETNYYRFFSYRKKLSHEQLASFTQIDYNREVAIIALVKENGKDVIVGVNRLVYYPNSEKYEFAIVVSDAWQSRGIGKVLMDKLIFIAKDKGIKTIYGSVLAENSKMLRFAKKLGFKIINTEGEIVYIKLEL